VPNTLDPTIRDLNDCSGCAGIESFTPVKLDNRPGLNRIDYRVGTHQRFFHSMLSRLSDARYPALKALNVRDSSDLTIVLFDVCSVADDVLTFYTERYTQEWYIRTASERVSLVQLARLIGYEPRPGVAATAYLAFTIETTPGTPELTTIESGTRVMSIPGKDELPQIFEISDTITARAIWNAMKVRTRVPQVVFTDMTQLVLEGIDGGLRKGDSILIVKTDSDKKVKRVQKIVADTVSGTTSLELSDAPQPSFFWGGLFPVAATFSSIPILNDSAFGEIFTGNILSGSDVTALGMVYNWSTLDLFYAANISPPPPRTTEGVFALRQRAAIFGHNAPRWGTLPQIVIGEDHQIIGSKMNDEQRNNAQYPTDWDNNGVTLISPANTKVIDLDNVYPNIVENSWIILESPDVAAQAFKVISNQELTRSDYTLSVKVSRLSLAKDVPAGFKMRNTTVLAVSDPLKLAKVPIGGEIQGNELILDKYYPGLEKDQHVILSGTRSDLNGVPGHEVHQLSEVKVDGNMEAGRLFTRLTFTSPLSFSYQPDTVTINANIAAATHGESKREVLGAGDGAMRFQTFNLKHKPLTYVSAETLTGAQSTLEVRVNNVKWNEVSTLYGLSTDDQSYVIRHEDDGNARVQFNAPLPSGLENISASYRIGIGLPGLLKANQLSMLAIKPLGVRGVTNPLPPAGAEDRESFEDLRGNSPLTVLTLDRLVSVKDYEDFSRAFAGFSKAQAIATGMNSTRGVFLTVAGETGEITESDQAFRNLVAAIKLNGDPFVGVAVKPYRPAFFQIEGAIGIDQKFLQKDVLAEVEMELRTTFGFAARRLGQSVTRIEVVAAIQKIPGVVFVNLTALFRSNPLQPNLTPILEEELDAASAILSTSAAALGAELLTLDLRPLALKAEAFI
jgi:predicted phage baseplate assembly protein